MGNFSISRSKLGFGVALAALLVLPACSTTKYTPAETEAAQTLTPAAYQQRTQEDREAVETQDLFAQAAFWSREYDLNPADLEAALKLSSALRRLGNPAQALEIAQTARAMYPRDTNLMAEYGANLIALERGKEAIAPLSTAVRGAPQNARLWSLLGAAHDQMGQYDRARELYGRALSITPNDPSVMANLGLSFALQGDARTAEIWLRRAAANPQASPGVRQNLALVLGLQGKYDEAEAYARQDLDPNSAENNLAYMRSMRSGSRSYGAMSNPEAASTATAPKPQPQVMQRPAQPHQAQSQAMRAPQPQYRPQPQMAPHTRPNPNSIVMRGALPMSTPQNTSQINGQAQGSSRDALMAYQARKSGAPAQLSQPAPMPQPQAQAPVNQNAQNPNVLARIQGALKPGGAAQRPAPQAQSQRYAQRPNPYAQPAPNAQAPNVRVQTYAPPAPTAQNTAPPQTQRGYPQRRPALRTRN